MTGRILISPESTSQTTTVRGRTMTLTGPALDVAMILALLGVGALSFGPAFGGMRGYLTAGVGVAVGGAVAAVARWRGWGVLSTAGAVLIAYLALGGPLTIPETTIAGVVPTPTTLSQLGLLLARAWRDLLTVGIPADGFPGPAVVPLITGLVCGALAIGSAIRGRRGRAALAASVLLVLAILFGVKSVPLARWQGGALAVLALVWALLARPATADSSRAEGAREESAGGWRRGGWRRGGLAVAMMAGAVGLALVIAPTLLAHSNRHVLRDDVVPPLDPRAFASPLAQYRHLVTDLKDVPLMTVAGLPSGARLRLATLDSYDGIVYNVAQSSASFLRIGGRLDLAPPTGPINRLDITVDGLTGPWLPGGGDVRELSFAGPAAREQARSLYVNPTTGTALTAAGIGKGTRYAVSVALPPTLDRDALATRSVREVVMPPTERVPEVVNRTATSYVEGKTQPYDQLHAIEEQFREFGFYSDGSDGKSRAGHTAERINAFLSAPQLIGDDEQYAVAMALMARSLQLPARVVVGFYPAATPASGPLVMTGKDAHVWVEVAFQPDSWVAFDPTPDRDRIPKTTAPKPQDQPTPLAVTPPDPPRTIADKRTDISTSRPPPSPPVVDPPAVRKILRQVVLIGGALLALASPFLLIAGLKRRRRRRRRAGSPSAGASGAWDEVVDRATDLGHRIPRELTRAEGAAYLSHAYPSAAAIAVAREADRATFGPVEPTAAEIHTLWQEVDRVLGRMNSAAGRRRAWLARISLRSLRRAQGAPTATTRRPRVGRRRLPTNPEKES
jgi:hypothetical protein